MEIKISIIAALVSYILNMHALRSIGWKKALSFVYWQVIWGIYSLCFLPQMRVWFLRSCGAQIGKDVVMMRMTCINLHHYGCKKLRIGDRCYIGDEVMFDMRGDIRLEDDVTLSSRVNVIVHMNVGYPDHPLQSRYPTREDGIVFKKGCYIGTAATILPGVTIGKESVVGAGAVVTRSVPDRSFVSGVPAKVNKSW